MLPFLVSLIFQVTSPPEEQVAITIVAFDTTNKDYEFLTQINGDLLDTYICKKELISDLLSEYESFNHDEDNKPLTDDEKLLDMLPAICVVKVQEKTISYVEKPLSRINNA